LTGDVGSFHYITLVFAFWSVTVDPNLVPRDKALQKSVTFIIIVVQ
jgi:hypothetical protein